MKTINDSNIPSSFWNNLEDYGKSDGYLTGFAAGAGLTPLLMVEDQFGYDYLYQLPDNRYVLGDRNSGEPQVLTQSQFDQLLSYS